MSTVTLDYGQLEQLAEMLTKPAPPLLDAQQAAEQLNVPSSWLLSQARSNRIPHIRLGRYVRFNRDELFAWTNRRQTGPTSKEKNL